MVFGDAPTSLSSSYQTTLQIFKPLVGSYPLLDCLHLLDVLSPARTALRSAALSL